jgi:hypothetical protein
MQFDLTEEKIIIKRDERYYEIEQNLRATIFPHTCQKRAENSYVTMLCVELLLSIIVPK